MVFPVLSWHRYVGWPAAKAHVAVLTGSLRNLQKLVTSIDDDGLLRLQLNLTNCRGFHSKNTAKTLSTFHVPRIHSGSARKETEYRALLWQIAVAPGT